MAFLILGISHLSEFLLTQVLLDSLCESRKLLVDFINHVIKWTLVLFGILRRTGLHLVFIQPGRAVRARRVFGLLLISTQSIDARIAIDGIAAGSLPAIRASTLLTNSTEAWGCGIAVDRESNLDINFGSGRVGVLAILKLVHVLGLLQLRLLYVIQLQFGWIEGSLQLSGVMMLDSERVGWVVFHFVLTILRVEVNIIVLNIWADSLERGDQVSPLVYFLFDIFWVVIVNHRITQSDCLPLV